MSADLPRSPRQPSFSPLPPRGSAASKRVARIHTLLLIISIFGSLFVIYDIGFLQRRSLQDGFEIVYFLLLTSITTGQLWLWRIAGHNYAGHLRWFGSIFLAITTLVILAQLAEWFVLGEHPLTQFLERTWIIDILLFIALAIELSFIPRRISNAKINGPLLFVLSFILVICAGAGLLLLPRATPAGISMTDAFFTSTSAVCVTGLIVRDTGTQFTPFGQNIILLLIQIGGLGIMTFTSFFTYFFQRNTSFNDQLVLKYLTNSDTLGDVLGALRRILILTFSIELMGAVLIYSQLGPEVANPIYFSIFHSVSAFCNAGFSTLPDTLATGAFASYYSIHWVIAALFIVGGLGFPILLDARQYLRQVYLRWWAQQTRQVAIPTRARFLDLNARLILVTTAALLLGGTIVILAIEWNGAFAGGGLGKKISQSFFAAATPRTAGFNTVSMGALAYPTIVVTMFLMWIGASPGSTGGGIKTSTFAVAALAVYNTARQKGRIEIYNRSIDRASISRAFAVVILSIVIIGHCFFALTILEPNIAPTDLIFECISAYSTVGLSLGITAQLGDASRWLLILLMFTGRVGILTILVATYRESRTYAYQLPEENILIN